jgi:tripeptidyl-peptidase-1
MTASEDGGKGTWNNDCDGNPSCKGLVTPGVLRERYSITGDSAQHGDTTLQLRGNAMGVAEFQQFYFDDTSLGSFKTWCHIDSFPKQVIGGNDPNKTAGTEAILDIEYMKAIAPEIDLTVWYSTEYNILTFVTAVDDMDTSTVPLVWSISYGDDENDQTGVAYMKQCDVIFQKLGVKGISLFGASGDQNACGWEGCGWFTKRYHPEFPSTSPHFTSVGGTDFETYSIGNEVAWSESGGGFSDVFPLPDYQSEAVKGYLSSAKLPASSLYNATGIYIHAHLRLFYNLQTFQAEDILIYQL